MSWIKSLFAGGIKEPVDAVGKVLDELFTSKEEKDAAAIVMAKLRQEPAKLQAQINLLEAQHRSVWVAGWRPFIGWVCGASLAFYFIPKFVVGTIVWVAVIESSNWVTIPPFPVDESSLITLVYALLGMGTLRTVEKAMGKTA